MSTLFELEARVHRFEKRWRESDQEFFDSMNEVAKFQARITRVTSLATAVAAGIALRVVLRYWLQMAELWAAAFAIATGIVVYGLFATWLDRSRVHQRGELRQWSDDHQTGEPDGAGNCETRTAD